jgi:hypothetical protein
MKKTASGECIMEDPVPRRKISSYISLQNGRPVSGWEDATNIAWICSENTPHIPTEYTNFLFCFHSFHSFHFS